MSFSLNMSISGLGSQSITMPVAGLLTVDGKLSLSLESQDVSQPAPPSSPPNSAPSGASQCVVTINQNGSPMYTGIAGATGFNKELQVAVGDVIAIVLSSSAAPDQGLNVIKGVVALYI